MQAGRWIGLLICRFNKEAHKSATRNISRAFSDKNKQQVQQLARRSLEHLGYSIAEFATSLYSSDRSYSHRIKFKNQQHLDDAFARGRGVLLIMPNNSVLDICLQATASKWPLAAMYSRVEGEFEALLTKQRKLHLQTLIPNDNVRAMVRSLQRGDIVFYSPDRAVPRSLGGRPFRLFGLPVLTTTATARMAHLSGAAIVPVAAQRDVENGHYLVCFEPELDTTQGVDQLTQSINDCFERQILRCPEQYNWGGGRFKSPY